MTTALVGLQVIHREGDVLVVAEGCRSKERETNTARGQLARVDVGGELGANETVCVERREKGYC